ncbi:MAG: DUF3375 domain-containing protein [Gammaproteobacteria bacterium]|nr:DUF3375 domain-containing protein [Gammaproteobacteria bacterium]MBU2056448.1 DUF3375 domain-containing protein [Gammaproteobacteria bacterium]MBU2173839.1 DUF3375 domain-containing protein [Gammaproteobacteria bacterium]MBU2248902.1 DUF3375 domain-containing protein [Gammaproteobacteria bacterium]MBU2344024.1 DUF3375 domain-containing protein [Gammaproteobacteria bacterium]
MTTLNYDYFNQFKEQSLALKLLRSPHFALLTSFFYRAFIQSNQRSVPFQQLVALLDQHLFEIAELEGDALYPKSAKAYLDDWVNSRGGYLRKYLPQHSDEPECDLLPDVEKALRYLEDMQGRQFVGTESQLKLLLEMINNLVEGSSVDQRSRLLALQQRKAELEQQIIAVELGQDAGFSDTQIRERLFLLADVSRQLLGDFRQVEANFRSLDKQTRKTISLSGGHKGDVLDQVFSHQDVIEASDEGQSFSSFFELLMTPQLRDGMRNNLQALLTQEQAKDLLQRDTLLSHLYKYLLEAGSKVNQTRQHITDQLRRYIQEQSQDNKRILELIREFEATAHQYQTRVADDKTKAGSTPFSSIPGWQADIEPIFSRQLFQPSQSESFTTVEAMAEGTAQVDLTALFALSHIDELQLERNIQSCLQQSTGQVTLADVVTQYPLNYGLEELVTYLKIACEGQQNASIDEQQLQRISWLAESDSPAEPGSDKPQPPLWRQVQLPTVTFLRSKNQ